MSTPDTGLLDQATERAGRWIAGRSSRRSLLGRIGDAALARAARSAGPPAAPTADADAPLGLFDQDLTPAPCSDSLNADARYARVSVQSSVSASADPDPDPDSDPAPAAPAAPAGPAAPAAPDSAPAPRPAAGAVTPPGFWSRQVRYSGQRATKAPADPAPEPAGPSDSLNAQPLYTRVSVQSSEGSVVELPEDAGAAAAAISRHRFPDGSPTAVLAPADPLLLAVAAPVAAVLNAPLLVGTSLATQPELERLNATRVVAIALAAGTEQLGEPSQSPHDISIAAAQFVRAESGTVRAFAISDTDGGRAIAGPVGAAAALRKFPVMIGAEAARSGALEGTRRAAVTYLVGKDVIAEAARVPGGFPLPAPRDHDVPNRLAQLLKADGVKPTTAAQAAADPTRNAVLAGTGGVVVNDLPDAADPTVTTRFR